MATRLDTILPTTVGGTSPAAPTVRATSAPRAPGAAPTSPDRPATPRAPSAGGRTEAVPRNETGVPQFDSNPLAAIGVVLQDFAAGLQGRELRSTQIAKETMIRRQFELEQIQVGADFLKEAKRIVQNTPRDSEERQQTIENLSNVVGGLMPGFDGMIERLEGVPDAEDVLNMVGEFADVVHGACGADVECILDKASDEDFIGPFRERRDNLNTTAIAQKLSLLTQGMQSRPEVVELLPRDAFGNVSINFSTLEGLNDDFPDGIRLSDSELGTLRRRPHILAAHGIMTPDALQSAQETLAKELAKEPFRVASDARQATIARAGRKEAAEGQIELEQIRQENRKEIAEMASRLEGEEDIAQRVEEHATALDDITGALETLSSLGPGSVGFVGKTAEGLGALAGQFFGTNADRLVTSLITQGDDTSAEVELLRRQLRKVVANSIPQFEELFGRISEAEREIAEQTSGLLKNLTNERNVRMALEGAYTLQLMKINRTRIVNDRPEIFDATSEEALVRDIKEFAKSSGIDPLDMARMARKVVDAGAMAQRFKLEEERNRGRRGPSIR